MAGLFSVLSLEKNWTRSTVVALLYVAIAGWGCSPVAEAEDEVRPPRDQLPKSTVVVESVRRGALRGTWSFPGEVRAIARASLAAGADGPVERVTVRVGDQFQRGDLLVEVNRDLALASRGVAKARVTEAAESLAQAKREALRLAELPVGVVPEQEREQASSRQSQAEAALAVREAEAREVQAQLERHIIRAPFDGVVSERIVDRGDWVRVGDPALEVVKTDEIEVIVDASSILLGKVQRGQKAIVKGQAETGLEVTGIVPALDPSTRTLRVRLVPTQHPSLLTAGSSIEVSFQVELTDPNGLLVSEDALLFDGNRTRLVKAVEGHAEFANEIEVIARFGGEALIRVPGLNEGDQVLTRGNERVRPNQPLEIKEL